MMCYAIWLVGLCFTATALDCSYYSQLGTTYHCSDSSYLTDFLLPHCNKLLTNTSGSLPALAGCIQQQVQQTIATISRYQSKLDCSDSSVGAAAYLQCLSKDPLRSYCESSNGVWYELMKTASEVGSKQLWDQVTSSFLGLNSTIIQVMAQQEKLDPASMKSFIDRWAVNVSTPAEQLCSRQATLSVLHGLQGKFQEISHNTPAIKQSVTASMLRTHQRISSGACINYVNTTIENRQNEEIDMSNCPEVVFSNVTLRNNTNLRIRLASVGSLILSDLKMSSNSGLEWRLSSIGRANFTRLTVTNCNQYNSDPESPQRRSLFTLNSLSLQLSELQVNNYAGSSLISLYDGSLFVTDCRFENIIIDSVYSSGGVIDLRRGSIMMVGSEFLNVSSNTGGGLYLRDGSANVASCKFLKMKTQKGGGIYLSYGSLAVSDSDFRGSTAQTGAAIYSSFSTVALVRITVANCTSNNGNLAFVNSTVNITQSEIDGNTAVTGAGIYSLDNSLLVDNANVFSKNIAEEASAVGCFMGSVSLTNNNVFRNNHQSTGNSPVGVQFGSATLDQTNQIEDDSLQALCGDNCGKCVLDPSTMTPVCSMCLLPYTLTSEHTCVDHGGGNPAWYIVLIVLVSIGLIVGGFFLYRRIRRHRAMSNYNQL